MFCLSDLSYYHLVCTECPKWQCGATSRTATVQGISRGVLRRVVATEQKSPITRRAVAKGIAWSVPAFAIATAAPALAQSPLVTIVEGDVCKYAGNSGPTGTFQSYLFPVTISNLSNEPVCIKATGAKVILVNGTQKPGAPNFWTAKPGTPGAVIGGNTICLGIGQSTTYWLVLTNTGNSANEAGTAYVDVTVTGSTTGRAYTDQATVSFATTPPDCEKATSATSSAREASPDAEETSSKNAAVEPEPTKEPLTEEATHGAEEADAPESSEPSVESTEVGDAPEVDAVEDSEQP